MPWAIGKDPLERKGSRGGLIEHLSVGMGLGWEADSGRNLWAKPQTYVRVSPLLEITVGSYLSMTMDIGRFIALLTG